MSRFCFLAALLSVATTLFSAQTRTLSGYVEDGTNGERLIGATVFDLEAGVGTTTNNFAFFSYTYRADTPRLRLAYVGLADLDTMIIGPPSKDFVLRVRSTSELATVTEVAVE